MYIHNVFMMCFFLCDKIEGKIQISPKDSLSQDDETDDIYMTP